MLKAPITGDSGGEGGRGQGRPENSKISRDSGLESLLVGGGVVGISESWVPWVNGIVSTPEKFRGLPEKKEKLPPPHPGIRERERVYIYNVLLL